MSNANSKQVAGTHYLTSGVAHWDYVTKQDVPYLEGNATKYLTRWKKKNGIQDLQKAAHYIEKRLECMDQFGAIRGAVEDTEMFYSFLKDNDVDYPESLIIRSVMHWTSREHLMLALHKLYELIESQGDATSAYVNQDA